MVTRFGQDGTVGRPRCTGGARGRARARAGARGRLGAVRLVRVSRVRSLGRLGFSFWALGPLCCVWCGFICLSVSFPFACLILCVGFIEFITSHA